MDYNTMLQECNIRNVKIHTVEGRACPPTHGETALVRRASPPLNPPYRDLNRFFAITIRWISLVPSPIVQSFESRQYFSAG